MQSVVRVSILRCPTEKFERISAMMTEKEAVLRPGIEAMDGLIAYYAGSDAATASLHNTSVWDSLDHAKQMDTVQPMLDSAAGFAAEGCTFERPIMNYATLWKFGPQS